MKRFLKGTLFFIIFVAILASLNLEPQPPKEKTEVKTLALTTMPTAKETQRPTIKPTEVSRSTKSQKRTYLGVYAVTAYNRTKDYETGAEGTELKENISCAGWIPFGTKIYIEGIGVRTVQDHTSQRIKAFYNSKIIDLYFSYDKQKALDFGVQYKKVWIIN